MHVLTLPALPLSCPVLPKCSTILPRDLLQWEVGAAIFISSLSTAQTFLITIHQLLILLLFTRHSLMTNANSCGTIFSRDIQICSVRDMLQRIWFHSIINTFVHTAQAVDKCTFLLCLSCPVLLKCSVRDGCPTSSKTQQYQVRFWLKSIGSPFPRSLELFSIERKNCCNPLWLLLPISYPWYDEVSDLMHNWAAQRPEFKSAVRVVKMVLNTQLPMLSISMAYNVISCKKIERNTQKIKIADFTM